MALKPLTPHERFYHQVLDLRRKLDQLLLEYEDSLPNREEKGPVKVVLIDPRTKRPFGEKKEHAGRSGRTAFSSL